MTMLLVTRSTGRRVRTSLSALRARNNAIRVCPLLSLDCLVDFKSKFDSFTDTKQTRVVKRTVPCESFFNFFTPPNPPTGDEEDLDDEAEEISERLELDYGLGEEIKEKLIPRAVDWYTGEALQYEDLDDGLDDGDYDDEDDEERFSDEDNDDDDEESDDEVSSRR